MVVASGLDVLAADGFRRLAGRRVAVLCHAASVAARLRHLLELLRQAAIDVRLLLGPEHGLAGAAQDMRPVASGRWGSVPVLSLYGAQPQQLRPPPGAFAEVDTLLVDLQDVGSRYYTYAATMRYCLEACAGSAVEVVVLDRPNPLGGALVEGPLLPDELRSFVGAWAVPVRHGLTLGELARAVLDEGIDVSVEVIPMQGWRRDMWFHQTGLPWVLPSPNMPTVDTAIVYPGACLVEATNLSEGRGTTRPFEILGAPWLDGQRLAGLLAGRVPGVSWRPLVFQPAFHKHAGSTCGGVQIHVVDREAFRPFACGLAFLWAARQLEPRRFAWREEPYEFVSDRPALDLLTGWPQLRQAIDDGRDPLQLQEDWTGELERYRQRRLAWLLYPEAA